MFKDAFLQILQDRQITPYKVAKATGISQGLMSEYANGKRTPSTKNLTKIANFLDVPVDTLLSLDTEESYVDTTSTQLYVPEQIYDKIESILLSLGLSIRQFEIDSGLSRGTLENMKKGSMPSVEKIAIIADGLNVSIDYLLGRESTIKIHEISSNHRADLSEDDQKMLSEVTDVIIRHRRGK